MNKKTVCIIDLIGSYAGMDYYDISLAKELLDKGAYVKILSTFNVGLEREFLPVMYNNNKLAAIAIMFYNYFKLLFYILFHRKYSYIYMTFGEITDFLFLTLPIISRHYYVDIHELYAAKYLENRRIKVIFNFYYKYVINNVVYHSDKTLNLLNNLGYNGRKLFVPHFKYVINHQYDDKNLGDDIVDKLSLTKTKLLFFGNLRIVKGIDIVKNCFINNNGDNVQLIIAGKNVENIDLDELRVKHCIIDRHINDDELKYLFYHSDFVLMPYRDSSQSGILEMAFSFRKPVILSNIPYFSLVKLRFPSIGEISDLNGYDLLIDKIIKGEFKQKKYYNNDDVNRFLMRKEINRFVNDFLSLMD